MDIEQLAEVNHDTAEVLQDLRAIRRGMDRSVRLRVKLDPDLRAAIRQSESLLELLYKLTGTMIVTVLGGLIEWTDIVAVQAESMHREQTAALNMARTEVAAAEAAGWRRDS